MLLQVRRHIWPVVTFKCEAVCLTQMCTLLLPIKTSSFPLPWRSRVFKNVTDCPLAEAVWGHLWVTFEIQCNYKDPILRVNLFTFSQEVHILTSKLWWYLSEIPEPQWWEASKITNWPFSILQRRYPNRSLYIYSLIFIWNHPRILT